MHALCGVAENSPAFPSNPYDVILAHISSQDWRI